MLTSKSDETIAKGPRRKVPWKLTAAVAFVDGIRSVMDTNTVPMGIAQRALNSGTHHDGSPWEARAASVIDVIASTIANPRVDSQRRRTGR